MRKKLIPLILVVVAVVLFACGKASEIADLLSNTALPSAVGVDYTK